MNKVSKIALAAAFAAGLAVTTPALAVYTTATDFVAGLSADFVNGDLASIESKLMEVAAQGFEGVLVDGQLMSMDRLRGLLAEVRSGERSARQVAAALADLLSDARYVAFVRGDMRVGGLDVGGAGGAEFPAGSAA
jgi:hypothetical protein